MELESGLVAEFEEAGLGLVVVEAVGCCLRLLDEVIRLLVVGRCSRALDTVWKVESLIDSVVVSKTGLLVMIFGGLLVVVVVVVVVVVAAVVGLEADLVVNLTWGRLSTFPGMSLLSDGFEEPSTSMLLSWGRATSGSTWWSSLQQLPK